MIDGNQYALIKARNILDSILIANECVDERVLKLDLEKAYDKTDWDFLDYVRTKKALVLFGGNEYMAASLQPTFQ